MLDVVIVNYRTPRLLEAAVESIERHMTVPYQIIVVDNSPPAEAIGEHRIENKGYGQACNYGVSLGDAPYLLILNADVEMRADSNVENCLALLDVDRIAVVGPKQVSPAGWIASAGCPPANNGVGYTIRGWKEHDRGQYTEPVLDCKYVAGSVVFTKRAIYEAMGGFLDEVLIYYEETYYCYLARHRGYRVVYTGQSVWTHHWDSSPKSDQHLKSGRPVARESHAIFARRLRAEGVPESEIPPFV